MSWNFENSLWGFIIMSTGSWHPRKLSWELLAQARGSQPWVCLRITSRASVNTLLGPLPEVLPSRFGIMLMLLVHGPHFEKHWFKRMSRVVDDFLCWLNCMTFNRPFTHLTVAHGDGERQWHLISTEYFQTQTLYHLHEHTFLNLTHRDVSYKWERK